MLLLSFVPDRAENFNVQDVLYRRALSDCRSGSWVEATEPEQACFGVKHFRAAAARAGNLSPVNETDPTQRKPPHRNHTPLYAKQQME
jgi:hypothetical protein